MTGEAKQNIRWGILEYGKDRNEGCPRYQLGRRC